MKKVLAVLISVLPATAAYAGFQVVSEQAPAQEQQAAASPQADASAPDAGVPPAPKKQLGFGLVAVSYIGDPPADIEVRHGFGRDVKLIDALKQIVPDGWHAFVSEDDGRFNKNQLVSWHGGRKWVEVLDIMASEQSLTVDVDWTKQQIYVANKKVNFDAVLPGKIIAPPKVYWVAKAGSTLRDSVTEWAQKAGWTVRWTQDDLDYPIIGDLTFDGSFENAITGIFRAYEKAARPMLVDGNVQQKLLVISEKK